MRIVSLAPFLTETVYALGCGESLVGVSATSDYPEQTLALPKLTVDKQAATSAKGLVDWLAEEPVHLATLRDLAPDLILTNLPEEIESDALLRRARELSVANISANVEILSFAPRTLEQIFEMFEKLEKKFKVAQGHDLSHRLKAQLMDWADNFYDRMKNKRVTFLSSVEPLALAGTWMPDLIHMCSAHSQVRIPGEAHQVVSWKEIVDFRPDVIFVAPENMSLDNSMRSFKLLEKLPDWETVPAVKRGEVVFCDGVQHFYRPGPRLRESMSILISAIAGFDSGYIAPRDCFYRLRWLEMQRHRF